MKKCILAILFIFDFFIIEAKENEARKLCNSFTDCIQKAEKTDIYRKKISYFEESLNLFKRTDKENLKIKIHLLKANAIIREAQGETGYKGDIPLKVTHKPEYKDTQFSKARLDLQEVEKEIKYLSKDERALYDELVKILDTE